MNKQQHPAARAERRKNPYLRKPVCITLDPDLLAWIDSRSANRSEQINADLARIRLIEEGRWTLTSAERRRCKALALMGGITKAHAHQIDAQEAEARAAEREAERRPTRPSLKSPWVMP